MTVAVRGRVPHEPEGKFTEGIAAHIAHRLVLLERLAAGNPNAFIAPQFPSFGAGNGTVGSGGGTVSPVPPTTTTVIIEQPASFTDLFLLMGA
jgi:hypothetical protein